MAEECLGDRRRVLEEEFFRKQEQAVLNQLRTAQAQQSAHEALAVATGVAGPAVLNKLSALGITSDTLLSLGERWGDLTAHSSGRTAKNVAPEAR